MDILVTHVYDKERFKHYLRLKFRIRLNSAISTIDSINNGNSLRLNYIPECEVRYLQSMKYVN